MRAHQAEESIIKATRTGRGIEHLENGASQPVDIASQGSQLSTNILRKLPEREEVNCTGTRMCMQCHAASN